MNDEKDPTQNATQQEQAQALTPEELEKVAKQYEVGSNKVESEGVSEEEFERLQNLAIDIAEKVRVVVDANAEHALAQDSEGKLAAIEKNKQARADLEAACEALLPEGRLAQALAVRAARMVARGDMADSIDAGNSLLNELRMDFERFTGLSRENLDKAIEELKQHGASGA